MKYRIKRSVLPFGIVCLMSMALCGCGREKKEAVTVQPELVIGSDDYEPYNYQNENGDYAGVDVELAKEGVPGYNILIKPERSLNAKYTEAYEAEGLKTKNKGKEPKEVAKSYLKKLKLLKE